MSVRFRATTWCSSRFFFFFNDTATTEIYTLSLHDALPISLLELLLLRAPELITRSEIVEHVWDCHFDSETNLVEVYINRLRQKIDQDRSVKLIHTIRGVGYRLGTPGS